MEQSGATRWIPDHAWRSNPARGLPVGVLSLARTDARPFTVKQIELARDLRRPGGHRDRDRPVIQVGELRTRELAKSLEDLRATQDRLVQTQKLASLGQLTAGIAHEIKNPLNFVNNFSGVSVELIDELQETHREGEGRQESTREEIAELADTLREQSQQDRAARPTSRLHRQEHAAAFARRLRRAAIGRRERPR